MHGAAGGAPKGNKNALKHGDFTAEAIETRRVVAALGDVDVLRAARPPGCKIKGNSPVR